MTNDRILAVDLTNLINEAVKDNLNGDNPLTYGEILFALRVCAAVIINDLPEHKRAEYIQHHMIVSKLTAARLREVLSYDPETGVFIWLVSKYRPSRKGSVAGRIHVKGYRLIRVDGVSHPAHRLAWLYMTGSWPTNQIDHKNGVKADNRFTNLREANNAQNQRNTRHRCTSKSGFKGVTLVRSRWRATIGWGGRTHHLGYFDTATEAYAVYRNAEIERDPEFVRFG